MVRPRAGVGEGVERGVQGNQSDDFVAGLVVEFLEGNLADDFMAEITLRPRWRRAHYAAEQEEQSKGQREESLTEPVYRLLFMTFLPSGRIEGHAGA